MKISGFLPKYNKDSYDSAFLAEISRGQLIIAMVGFCLSIFAVILHVKLKFGQGGPLVCDINGTINCTKIIGSEFGELFGISLGAYGMAFFGIAIGVSILPLFTKVSKGYVAFWRFFVALIGMTVAAVAAFIAYVVLEGVCEVCSSIQLVCLVYFGLALHEFVKNRRGLMFGESVTFQRLVIMTIVLFSTPLLIAAAGSNLYQSLSKKNVETTPLLAAVSEDTARYSRGKNGVPEDYRKGSDAAPIVLVEFTDFECPFCQKLHFLLAEIQHNLGGDNLLIVFRHWPLEYHRHSKNLAIAARCVGRQGRFWEMADWIFKKSAEYSSDKEMKDQIFSLSSLANQAVKMGIADQDVLDICIEKHQEEGRINDDIKEAKSLGGTGTPFIIINGAPYKGNWLEKGVLESDLKRMIERFKK